MREAVVGDGGLEEGQNLAAEAEGRTPVLSEAEQLNLVRRFLLRDPAAESDLALHLNRLLHRVYSQRWDGQGLSFLELRGDCFVLLARWRDEKKVPVEPLPHLAQRLLKQVGRQALRDRHGAAKVVSLDEGWDEPRDEVLRRRRDDRERQASLWNAPRDPEQELLAKELYRWLLAAREKLPLAHQAAFDGCVKVAEGEAASLAAALGCKEDAAKQRRHRLRVALGELALQDGMDVVIQRWKNSRTPRRDRKEESA
ncbi:MAG: RNA polymerase sigma factor [Myxococcales bacterium]